MSSTAGSSIKSDTVNYLLLYEAMVRHQDLEFDATSDHIKLTIGRIKMLGRRPQLQKSSKQHQQASSLSLAGGDGEEEKGVPNDMITYREMRRCLLRLGYTWNRCTSSNNNAMTTSTDYNNYYDDDNISVISNNSSSTRQSGGTSGSATGFGNVRDIIATDAQLIMLLTTLVEMEERYHYSTSSSGDDSSNNKKDVFPQGLFIAEFVQAYKLIIGGMQSLQTYPSPQQQQQQGTTNATNNKLLQELRARSRERTLGLLRLFGPDSSLYTKSLLVGSSSSSSLQQQSAGESPAGRNQHKRNAKKNAEDGLSLTPNRSPTKKKGGSGGGKEVVAKDGLLPRLTDAEIRKMVHSKDIALAKILEEHESEMNVMAMNMEELRLKNLRTNAALKKRKKRARVVIVAMTLILTVGGGCMEYMKREQVKREIASGREAERKADTELIAQLKSEIDVLTSKLSDAEATIRYEESRYDTIKQLSNKNEKALEDMEHKWKIESAELEKCRVIRKELDGQVTTIKLKNVEMDEEVTWCRERLASTESAMEGMERVLSKSRNEKNKNGGVSFAEIVKAVELEKKEGNDDDDDDENKEKNSRKQPVLMEMKYNKSFRNAVFLRQAYSAVAGVAASVLLQGILPGVANVIRMVFFK